MNIEAKDNGTPDIATLEKERRQSYRISAKDVETPIRGEITLATGHSFPIEIINYSGVGLLCYIPVGSRLSKNDLIPTIKLIFDRKEPVCLSGEIVRLEKGEERYFCGIRFGEPGTSRPSAERKEPPQNRRITDEIRTKWLKELKAIPNYMHLNHSRDQILAERMAYERFSHITERLSIEERWWFFEMLDELKRKEPLYPQRLLDEFIAVCEWGYSTLASKPPWQKSHPGLWQRFIEFCKRLWKAWFGNY